MLGLVPSVHGFLFRAERKAWILGTRPRMTIESAWSAL
jgi:hypothetical protein